MTEHLSCKIEGAFTGYNGGAIFKLANGQAWQQKIHKYKYKYEYRPNVRILQDGGEYILEVECMDETVAVVKVSILEEGAIASDFNGFDQNARFEFESGRVWVPAEYKYNYHYAFRPHAIIVNGINGAELSVDGMGETLRVRQT